MVLRIPDDSGFLKGFFSGHEMVGGTQLSGNDV